MKCLHILPMDKLSGAEKMVLILCKNMKKYEPIVVCGGDKLKNIFEDNGIKGYSLSFSNRHIYKTLIGLKKIINENNIKIVHAHDNYASLNAYLTKILYRLDVKVISHIHSCYQWLKGINRNKILDSIFRKNYDYNIVCGKLVYKFYRENAEYFKSDKTLVLSNAIDIDEIKSMDTKICKEAREKFKIPNDKTIIGFVGRICEIKAIIPFIKEIARYKDYFSDCRFLIVGSGEQEEAVKQLIRELQLDPLFILTGFQDDVYKFYPLIDIFFLTSLYEGLPMVILEAMAFKKPVVAMDVGSINELVKNEYNGYLINEQDFNSFIKALQELKNNKSLRTQFGKNSLLTIEATYNIKTYINRLIQLYDRLLAI